MLFRSTCPLAVRNWIVASVTVRGSTSRLKFSTMFAFCAISEIWQPVLLQPRLHESRQSALLVPVQDRAAPEVVPEAAEPPEQPVRLAKLTTSAMVLTNRKCIDASICTEMEKGPRGQGQRGA